jgi:hypothetical protein
MLCPLCQLQHALCSTCGARYSHGKAPTCGCAAPLECVGCSAESIPGQGVVAPPSDTTPNAPHKVLPFE